ncbi:MAG: hypothetical protein ACM3JD_01885, partial [Rudaea sp.]
MPPESTPARIKPTPEYVRNVLARHRLFLLTMAVGLSGLFLEEAAAVPKLWGAAPVNDVLFGVLAFVIALVGNALAFLLPPLL